MKNVILSANSTPAVYSVPDIVADNLLIFCFDFLDWLRTDPDAEKYRMYEDGVINTCFGERDFIGYLNTWVYPDTPSQLIETLENGIPEKYENCGRYNF